MCPKTVIAPPPDGPGQSRRCAPSYPVTSARPTLAVSSGARGLKEVPGHRSSSSLAVLKTRIRVCPGYGYRGPNPFPAVTDEAKSHAWWAGADALKSAASARASARRRLSPGRRCRNSRTSPPPSRRRTTGKFRASGKFRACGERGIYPLRRVYPLMGAGPGSRPRPGQPAAGEPGGGRPKFGPRPSLSAQASAPKPQRPSAQAQAPKTQPGRLPSMAASTAGSSGTVRGRNRATTAPSGPITNFSKFHWMSPASPDASGTAVSSA